MFQCSVFAKWLLAILQMLSTILSVRSFEEMSQSQFTNISSNMAVLRLILSKTVRIACLCWQLLFPESSSFKKIVSMKTLIICLRCLRKCKNKQQKISITSQKITSSCETLYRSRPSQSVFLMTSMNSLRCKSACFGALNTVKINSRPIILVRIANLLTCVF